MSLLIYFFLFYTSTTVEYDFNQVAMTETILGFPCPNFPNTLFKFCITHLDLIFLSRLYTLLRLGQSSQMEYPGSSLDDIEVGGNFGNTNQNTDTFAEPAVPAYYNTLDEPFWETLVRSFGRSQRNEFGFCQEKIALSCIYFFPLPC